MNDLSMRIREKIYEIKTTVTPNFMVGEVIELEGEPLIIAGIEHDLEDFATSTLQVVRPHWTWRVKYRVKCLVRRVWGWVSAWWKRRRERS